MEIGRALISIVPGNGGIAEEARCPYIYLYMHTRRLETTSTGWRVIVPLAGRLKRSRVPDRFVAIYIRVHEAPGETCQTYVTDPRELLTRFQPASSLRASRLVAADSLKLTAAYPYVGNPLNLLLVIVYVPHDYFPSTRRPGRGPFNSPRSSDRLSSPREERFPSSSVARSF